MTPLQDLSLGRRILLAVVIILFTLFVLFVASKLLGYEAEAQTIPPSQWDEHILEMDKQAADDAYRSRLIALFDVWMRDATDQPQRATAGAMKARRAYIEFMQKIQVRDKEIQERKGK